MPNKEKKSSRSFLQIGVAKTNKSKIKTTGWMNEGIVPKHPFRLLISGASGSGKSNLLLDLLTCKKKFHSYFDIIFIISPTCGKLDDSYNLLVEKMKQGRTKLFMINDLDPAQVKHIMTINKKIIEKKGAHKSPKILIVYDDIISDVKFMNSKPFKQSFVASRHYNASVVICTQKYNAVPRVARLQASHVCYFRGNQSEDERIIDEFCPPKYTKREFEEVLNHATRKPYSFLYVNTFLPFRVRYRECLHTILTLNKFEDDNDCKDDHDEKNDEVSTDGDEGDEGDEDKDNLEKFNDV